MIGPERQLPERCPVIRCNCGHVPVQSDCTTGYGSDDRAARGIPSVLTARGNGTVATDGQVVTCPGCSGEARNPVALENGQGWTATCNGCGGLLGEVQTRQAFLEIVNLDRWDGNEEDDSRYFDVTVAGDRIHGWFNARTGDLRQIG